MNMTALRSQLEDWRHDPSVLDDLPEVMAPTDKALLEALTFLDTCEPDVPTFVAPDGEGGIVFEWRRDPEYVEVTISAEGAKERLRFVDCKLVERCALAEVEES